MDYNSNKSKGYVPLSSGPNMTGYYMGESPNLLGMQTGGSFGKPQPFGKPRTPGAALLARALQGQKDRSLLEDYEREEAKRQAKGGLFGSVLGTVGGLAGAAIGGPAGAAVGTSLGKGLGEKWGAGKSKDYDKSGTVYAQQRFRDVDEASDEYNKGIVGRSLVEGAKAGLTAGLTPGGGQYGQYNPFSKAGQEGLGRLASGAGVTGYTGGQSLFGFATPEYASISSLPKAPKLFDTSIIDRSLGLGQSSRLPFNFEDGGLIGYVRGGLTAQDVLHRQGLHAGSAQLGLFESFDPSGIQQSTQNIGQEISTQTGGQGLSSLGGGFGAKTDLVSTMAKQGQDTLENKIKQEQKDYESGVLGTAADIVAGGGEFQTYVAPDADRERAGKGLVTRAEGSSFQPLRDMVMRANRD